MNFTQIVNLGYNCGATETVKRFVLYRHCSPFDWNITTPLSLCHFLSFLYVYGVEKSLEKFMDFGDEKVNSFGVYMPHFSVGDRDKFFRRIKRLEEDLLSERNILFVYIGTHTSLAEMEGKIVGSDLEKLQKIIGLFRPQNTYRLAYVHQTREVIDASIDDLLVPLVPEEKYWIFPCTTALKNKYSLEENGRGRWI